MERLPWLAGLLLAAAFLLALYRNLPRAYGASLPWKFLLIGLISLLFLIALLLLPGTLQGLYDIGE